MMLEILWYLFCLIGVTILWCGVLIILFLLVIYSYAKFEFVRQWVDKQIKETEEDSE
jgi:hypothetical protein